MRREILDYLSKVCDQIRWKKAHETVKDELAAHIEDQRDALMREGLGAEAATRSAVREMGDPVSVGTLLDHTYRPRMDWRMAAAMLAIILGVSVLEILFNSGFGDWIITPLIGCCCFAAALFLDFTYYAKISIPLFIVIAGITVSHLAGFGRVTAAFLPVAFAGLLFFLREKSYIPCIAVGVLWVLLAAFHRVDDLFILPCVFVTLAVLAFGIHCGFFSIRKRMAYLILAAVAAAAIIVWIAYLRSLYEFAMQSGIPETVHEQIASKIWSGVAFFGPGTTSGPVWTEASPEFLVSLRSDLLILLIAQEFGVLAAIGLICAYVAFFIFLYKRCMRQRSMLGRLVSFAAITTLAAFFLLNLLICFIPPLTIVFGYAALPFIYTNVFYILTQIPLLGVILSTLRIGHIVQDDKLKAIAR